MFKDGKQQENLECVNGHLRGLIINKFLFLALISKAQSHYIPLVFQNLYESVYVYEHILYIIKSCPVILNKYILFYRP